MMMLDRRLPQPPRLPSAHLFQGRDRLSARTSIHPRERFAALAVLGAALAACLTVPVEAQVRPPAPASASDPAGTAAPESPAGPSYARLVTLAEGAQIVAIAAIAEQVAVKPERAPGLAAGRVRLYLRATTESLLAGPSAIGESLAFLADRPLDDKGRAPKLKKQRFLLFGRSVAGRPGEIQLLGQGAMLPAAPELVERTRTVLRQLAEGPALPRVTGVREAISVPGNLAGESETQLFLKTEGGEPVSLTVLRRPNQEPQWGVSWTDIVDPAAKPAAPGTLAWYSLACFLPQKLPDSAFLQEDAAARDRARQDYGFVIDQLGSCDTA